MDELLSLTHQLEYEFIKKIINGLETKNIDIPSAKQYAIEFLSMEPFESVEDANNKIANFCQEHKEFLNLKEYMDAYNRERSTHQKVNTMRKLIKENNIDEALNIAKQ